MLPLCARSQLCLRAAPAHCGYSQNLTRHQIMKQSTIGKFFAKPAASQGAAKPLAPLKATRDANTSAKGSKSPEKKRARPGQVRRLHIVAVLLANLGHALLQISVDSTGSFAQRLVSCLICADELMLLYCRRLPVTLPA